MGDWEGEERRSDNVLIRQDIGRLFVAVEAGNAARAELNTSIQVLITKFDAHVAKFDAHINDEDKKFIEVAGIAKNHSKRIGVLENAKTTFLGFKAGAVFVVTGIGGVIGTVGLAVWSWVADHLTHISN